MRKMTKEDLQAAASANPPVQPYIKVGMSTCGIAAGAQDVFDTLAKEIKRRDVQIELKRTGCVGMCYAEPLIEVYVEGLPVVTYGMVNSETALRIMEEHVCGKRLVNDHIFDLPVRR
ncbi:MAG: (2Fe-2S) ferredoxin domain-containing protein [Fibrobacter sp.]|jgi:NADP-reducing hydrogenase subunit HndB|nr:(2Fe-2S) ferredoxin domain-containing protein [Fibrobacter sp.]